MSVLAASTDSFSEAPFSARFIGNLSDTFDIMFMYNRLGWESIAFRVEVMLMQFSLTEVIMLGMFLLALLNYLKKRK